MNPIEEIIIRLKNQELNNGFTAREFILHSLEVLEQFTLTAEDVLMQIDAEWDPMSCLPHPVDTDDPPYLLDLYASANWTLRATLWPPSEMSDWRDVFHSHFGFIATKAITDTAYKELILPNFSVFPSGVIEREHRKGSCHFIEPETIHKVMLPECGYGLTLSVRSRSVERFSHELNEGSGEVSLRTKSACDRKMVVKSILGSLKL